MVNIAKTVGLLLNGISFVAPRTAGKLTVDLFCRPKEGKKFTAKEMAFLKQAKWSEVYFDEKKIQCYTWGTGAKTVLLGHGFNSNAARWRPLVGLLNHNGYKVVAFDAPAHGNSEWKRVNGLLYAAIIGELIQAFKPNYVVGHSFAGIAFSYYFSKMKHLSVEKIILLGVPNELTDISTVFFKELHLNKKVETAYFKVFEEKFGYPAEYFTLSNLMSSVPYHGLIIHDEMDDIASFKGAQLLHEKWNNSSFLATKNLGHSLQGRSVYAKIVSFLNAEVV